MTKNNPFKDKIENLRRDAVVEFPAVKAACKPIKHKNFVVVPLNDDWGYRVMTVAGRGAGIVLHVLYVQITTGQVDVPVTAAVLRRCGVDRDTRTRTIDRLVKAGFATVRRRGKFRGCPLLTLYPPGS